MIESLMHTGWLCLSAAGAGAVNVIAGGGTLLTFPALLAVLSPVIANATSTVALVPGSLAGAWGFRSHLSEVRRWISLLIIPSLLGGAVGALLLTRLPQSYFAKLVPWLILSATVIFICQPFLARLTAGAQPDRLPSPARLGALMAAQFLVAIYGGYFGAGIGILMLSSLSVMGIGDIHQMNAVKNILAASINGVAVLIFIFQGAVAWKLAAPMIFATVVGGYGAARLAGYLKKPVVRSVVITIGIVLTLHYFIV